MKKVGKKKHYENIPALALKRGFDWKKMPRYPESRPADMLESVRRLLQLGASGQVDVVLPGHNQVI